MFVSLLASPASAADVSLRTVLLAPNVSSTTGEVTNDGVSMQFVGTIGESFGDIYTYAGVFADYSFDQDGFTEINPFIGASFAFSGDVQIGVSTTLVHNLQNPVSLAGNLTVSRAFTLSDEMTVTTRIAWMPQWVFGGQSGHYLEVGTRLEWRPTEFSDRKLVADGAIVYDTGAYGAPEGVSYHLEPKVRWRVTDWLALEFGPEFHWSKTGALNSAFLLGWTFSSPL